MSPRAGLDRAAVVTTAAELADSAGLEQVTIAHLADRLGVRAPSLYNHIGGLDELRRELALLGMRELAARLGRAAVGQAGDDAVRAIATAYRAYARQRPGVYAATQRAPDPADAGLVAAANEVVAIVVVVLGAYGLRGDDALHATRALRGALHGFVSLESTGGFGLPLDLDLSFQRLVTMLLAGLRARA